MNTKKIYVVGNSREYSRWIKNHELVDNLADADIVLFTGGEDVDPSLYGKQKHHTTYSNIHRDLQEKEIFDQVKPNQLCLGICRGLGIMALIKHGELLGRLRWQSAA
jgi:gamma-glutamyl-gamma-aminobutyrate hydrolase PuuD